MLTRGYSEDGFYTEVEKPAEQSGPKQKQRVVKKIPKKVIQNAVGLAIFTTMRTGFWVSGSGGSGVLVARQEDGSWSPPSGIMLHTAGLGFLVGVDIYDCVLVINNRKALEAFTKIRATLGGEISAVAGPVGAGGVLENDGKWKQANRPVFTYLKSRGFYAGVQIDGTIMIERTDENARFYGKTISAAEVMSGNTPTRPPELKLLMETLKAAEGRTDVDEEAMEELEGQPAPGDVNIDMPGSGKMFGIPDPSDPDPFGVHALEGEGLQIRDAATHSTPSSQQFEYHPSPSSPVYNIFQRKSEELADEGTDHHSRDPSSISRKGPHNGLYTSTEAATQTDPVIRSHLPTRENAASRHNNRYGFGSTNGTGHSDKEKNGFGSSPRQSPWKCSDDEDEENDYFYETSAGKHNYFMPNGTGKGKGKALNEATIESMDSGDGSRPLTTNGLPVSQDT